MSGDICAVPGCTNTQENCRGKDVKFHSFPSNPEILRQWKNAIGKEGDWIPRKKLRVCSIHFTPSSYASDKRKYLKRTAVPSVWGEVSSRKMAKLDTVQSSHHIGEAAANTSGTLELQVSTENEYQRSHVLSDTEDLFHEELVLEDEEPVPEPIGSQTCSDSTEALGIDSSSSYEPSLSGTQESEAIQSEDEYIEGFVPETKPHLEDKYIVFISQLLLLFKFCRRQDCQNPIVHLTRNISGSCLTIKTECLAGHNDVWESQSSFGQTSWGNYLLAAAIFFSGEIPSKCLRVFKNLNIKVFSIRMYFLYQRMFHPIIEKFWVKEQEDLLLSDPAKKYTLCGDGRADSPGFSAKYGTYTFMDAETSKILHVELVQSTDVTASNQMELEGLKRGLEFFSNMMIGIAKIVTDRNQGVIAYLRDTHTDIIHEFDNWHVAKNIKAKLAVIAKKKSYSALNLWIPGITNHIYWVGASSTTRDERKDKWLSMLNHITDVHEGHGKEFPKCQHGPLEERDERIWLARGTKLFDEVSKVVNSPYTLAAIYQLSSKYQTYSVEVFHSVLNSFSPKMYHFTKDSMQSRIYLAALHYNENGHKEQAKTAKGEEQFYISYPKAKSGAATVRKVLVESTYEYVGKLMQLSYEQAVHSVATDLITTPSRVATLSSLYSKDVSKADLVAKLKSRFQ